eukprot:720763-Amphidinium_carterae.1
MEQPPDMFCVSNDEAKRFVEVLVCAACMLLLKILQAYVYRQVGRTASLHGMVMRARCAWYETSQRQSQVALVAFAVLGLCCNLRPLACMVVSQHSRLQSLTADRSAETFLVVSVHMWMCWSAVCFHRRHAQPPVERGSLSPAHKGTGCSGRSALSLSQVYVLWFLVCVIMSSPGIFYSAVKSVPTFLTMSATCKWIFGSVVSLWAGLVAGLGLPVLAKFLREASGHKVDSALLQLVGKLLASVLLPFLVTTLLHAKCLGVWVRLWEPCGPEDIRLRMFLQFSSRLFDGHLTVQSKSTVCGARSIKVKECLDATVERLAWLLYPKFVHFVFTMAAVRVVKKQLGGRGMTLKHARVLLSYTWLVITLFGVCLPILNLLVVLLAKIHAFLLFASDSPLLDMHESREQSTSVL